MKRATAGDASLLRHTSRSSVVGEPMIGRKTMSARRSSRTESGKIDSPNPAATSASTSICGAACTICGEKPESRQKPIKKSKKPGPRAHGKNTNGSRATAPSATQAEAGRVLSKSRFERTGKLVDAGVASQQELEQTQAESSVGDANINVAQAAVEAELANIRRLTDVQRFSKVTAPFAGTITARSVERGSLVTAGNATPLFRLAATDTVRVYVQVPQDVAASVSVGAAAKVTVRELTGRVFEGRVAHTAGVLDSVTRTLNTEIRVPNPDAKLLSGVYAEVSLNLSAPRQVYEIPATALLNDAQGVRVAIVRPDGTLHLQPIAIERDLGSTLQVSSGIGPTDRIVQIAAADLIEGQKVEAVAPKQPAPPAAAR
jgi:RND family efflux transporter MFP subunit